MRNGWLLWLCLAACDRTSVNPDGGGGADLTTVNGITYCTLDASGLAAAQQLVLMTYPITGACLTPPLTMPTAYNSASELRAAFSTPDGGVNCSADPTGLVTVDYATQRVVLVPFAGGRPSIRWVYDTGSKIIIGVVYPVSGDQPGPSVVAIAIPKSSSPIELRTCNDTCDHTISHGCPA
jgi:hypothetical protein